MIYISRLTLKNYRRMMDAEIPLKPHTIIIGENDSGKSSVLELLDAALNPTRRGVFLEESDFTHGLDQDSSRIEAIIEIRPWSGPVFGTYERAIFDPHLDVLADGNERILLKLEHFLDPEEGNFRTRIHFVKSDGEDDGPFVAGIKRNVPFFLIPALRNAARDIVNRGGTWGRIVSGIKLQTESKERIREIATEAADDILHLVLGNEAFTETTNSFGELLESVLWMGESTGELTFSAMPTDQRELLQSMRILIRNPGESQGVSILDHGDGTQSIAVVSLMLAYVNAMGYSNAILAVEEPESHLHPHATRSLIRYLWNKPRQVIITTHSIHAIDVVKLNELVLLKRRGVRTIVRFVPDDYFSEQEFRELSRYIHTTGSEFFFAKCILLTEGMTETLALPIFAKALGIDFDRLGVSLVDISGSNFRPFIRLFQEQALDMGYIILCDNDDAAVSTANTLYGLDIIPFEVDRSNIDEKRNELEDAGLYFLPTGNFEQYIMDEGFVTEYEQAIAQVHGADSLDNYITHRCSTDDTYSSRNRTQQILDFIQSWRRKPEVAFEVANILTDQGQDSGRIPPYFTHVIQAIETLSKQQWMISDGATT